MNTLYVDGCLKSLNDTLEMINNFYTKFEVKLATESDDFRRGLRFGLKHIPAQRDKMMSIEREADDLRTMNPFGEGERQVLYEVLDDMFGNFSMFDESDAEYERGFRLAYQLIENQLDKLINE
jgi:hypothetical protein